MKKFKRIFLLIITTSLLFFGCWVLIEEFNIYNISSRIQKDPTLLIPVHISLFSTFSVLLGIKKFQNSKEINSSIYKVLRIGDIIFSTTFLILLITGMYYLFNNPNEKELDFYLIRYSVILLFLFFTILLFIDNIKYHKELELLSKKDDIHEIGK